MTREIKFRALAPILKGPKKGQLVWWNDVMTDGVAVIADFRIMSDKPLREIKAICQYTGLKDKNGAEIYEGDLWDCGWDNPQEVRYNEEQGHYELIDSIYGQVSDYIAGYDGVGEIVGNIHENPELLK